MSFSSSYHFSSTSSFYLSDDIYQNNPPHSKNSIPVPISIPSSSSTSIPIHHPNYTLNSAATKIQSRYRSHLIRLLIRKIRAIQSEADRLQRLIQRQETVDAVRSNEKERVRLNENLMKLLLELDSVPGYFDPNVRELRRNLSRRIVALQETLDGIVGEEMDGVCVKGLPGSLREFVEKIWAEEEEDDGEHRQRCDGRRIMRCMEEFLRRGVYV